MAFKMKGDPMGRNFGVGKTPMYKKESPYKNTGDPKKQTSTSATTNLLGRLDDYEANKAAKDLRDSPDTKYYVGDLAGGEAAAAGGDAPASTKKEVAKRKAAGKVKQDRRKAQSTESYLAMQAKMDAAAARRKEKKAKKA